MTDSILTSTKKILGLDEAYTAFDLDVITHINSALATVSQLGVGPEEGLMITDDTTTWSELFTDNNYNTIKSYVYLRTRILFDPPNTSFLNTALNEQLRELEWRISAYRESMDWVAPEAEAS